MRLVPQRAITFLQDVEGLETEAYVDVAGVWTVGYGHTGADVTPGMRITKQRAIELLAADLAIAARRLAAVVKPEAIERLADSQYAALLSFVFNLGANPGWTIWKVLNAGDLDNVPVQLMRFNKAKVGGKLTVVRGLANRRAKEAGLWNEAVGEDVRLTSGDMIETPPTDFNSKPLRKSKTVWAGVGVTAAGAAQVAGQALEGARTVQGLVAPQAAYSSFLSGLLSASATAIVVLGVAIMVFKWLEQRSNKR